MVSEMLIVYLILGAMLPKSIFGRTGFELISLFEKDDAEWSESCSYCKSNIQTHTK